MSRPSLLFAFAAAVVLVALTSGCGASTPQGTTPGGGCSSGIEYQGRNVDLEASWNILGIKGGSEVQAIREVSDVMKIYFEEAANLCSLYERGEMSADRYASSRSELSARFAGLVGLNQALPAAEVEDNEMPLYLETLSALKQKAPAQQTGFALAVLAGGREIPSGAALGSGDGFRLAVNVPQRSYLYVVLVDSSGAVSRLYPSRLTGAENPVQGAVAIPNDPGAELALDSNPGTERILVFVQANRSEAIESLLEEVGEQGAAPPTSALGMVLTRGVTVRQKVAQSAAGAAAGASSFLGMAAQQFVIEHQP